MVFRIYRLYNLSILLYLLEFLYSYPISYETGAKKDIQSHTLTVCRGQMRSIACPNLQLLHIFNAFYGKLSGHDCQDPVTQLRDQIPTCFSQNAPKIIRESCQGQQSCDLYAEDNLYQDPCPSVRKYLFVSFTCQGKSELPEKLKMFQKMHPSPQQTLLQARGPLEEPHQPTPALIGYVQARSYPMSALVCGGHTSNIFCPELKLIKIKSAIYGKQQGRDCTGGVTRDRIPTCYARDTMTIIKNMCQGQQSCDLFTDSGLYGKTSCDDNVLKYLEVDYACEGHSDLEGKLGVKESAYPAPKAPQNLYLRSNLPIPFGSIQPRYNYNPWQYNLNGRSNNPYRRTGSWPSASPYGQQMQQPPNFQQQYYAQPSVSQFFTRQQQVQQQVQPFVRQQPLNRQIQFNPVTTKAMQFNPTTAQQRQVPKMTQQSSALSNPESRPDLISTRHSCEQCNGDCNNYLCYGCGGCPEPPPERQTYFYPYQRHDAAYHDAFKDNGMALSGLVMWPIPKVPNTWKRVFAGRHHRGKLLKKDQTAKLEDDDDDDDDDDDSDDDDNEGKSKGSVVKKTLTDKPTTKQSSTEKHKVSLKKSKRGSSSR